jgi:hypothetical protein
MNACEKTIIQLAISKKLGEQSGSWYIRDLKFQPQRKIIHALDNNCHPAGALAAWSHRPHWRQLDSSSARDCGRRADYQFTSR